MTEEGPAFGYAFVTRGWPYGVVEVRAVMKVRTKPIGTPLPGIARHGIKPITVWGKGIYRTGARIAILARVVIGEFALPDVAAMFSVRPQFVAPGIKLLFQATARGIFPLGFRR